MKKITNRLARIAELIGKGKTVADIGTDHGFLPIYMKSKYESPFVILSDISSPSLQKAKDNIKKIYKDEDIKKYFDFRLGSGIDILEEGEVDSIVFAGMGGELMVELLEKDLKKTESFFQFVFQPRTAAGYLRHFLITHGFLIKQEALVVENKFICEIISAVYDKKAPKISLPYAKNDAFYDITPKMFMENKELCKKLIERRIKKEDFILNNMKKSKLQFEAKETITLKNLNYLNKLLENYDK